MSSVPTGLWCVVDGDAPSAPFTVTLPGNINTLGVKTLIKREKPKAFENVDASDLTLWKLNVTESVDPDDTLLYRIRQRGKDLTEIATKMSAAEKVLLHFANTPEDHLHIVVQVPKTVRHKRFRSPSDDDSWGRRTPRKRSVEPAFHTFRKHSDSHATEERDYVAGRLWTADWLIELHEKLWGRKDLLDKIIRTVTLDKTDLIELEVKLQELNPSRGDDAYVPQDVLLARSAFLRSKNASSAETIADPEVDPSCGPTATLDVAASSSPQSKGNSPMSSELTDLSDDDDDGTVASVVDDVLAVAPAIFPCNVRYMDLTSLELKFQPRVPTLMLIRHEWDIMTNLLEKRPKGINGSVIITGQPGNGKTCFLYYSLVLRLVASQPTLFQDISGAVFAITERVRQDRLIEGNDVLTLVDADGAMCIPDQAILGKKTNRILLTSSPRTNKDRRWMKQHAFMGGQVLIMAPLSWGEMFQIALFFIGTDIPFKRIRHAVEICGTSPRPVLTAAQTQSTYNLAKQVIIQAIRSIKNLEEAIRNVHGDNPEPHRALEICPKDPERLYGLCLVRPVSQWAFEHMIMEVEKREQDGAYKFYKQVMGVPDAAAFRGLTWERRVHQYFRSISTPTTFGMKSLDDPADTIDITFSSQILHTTFPNVQSFTGELATSVRDKTSCYLKPKSKQFATIDSFLYDCEASHSGFQSLILCQMTDALKHEIKIVGLEATQKSLNRKNPHLRSLRPVVSKKWIIAFVVPAPMGASFSKQKFTSEPPHWESKTSQYVLELNLEDVFGIES